MDIRQMREQLWAKTPADYRSIGEDGVRRVLCRTIFGATVSVPLEKAPLFYVVEALRIGRAIQRAPLARTEKEFIRQYPGDLPGMSVRACAVLAHGDDGSAFVLGGEAIYVWRTVRERKVFVDDILYAGDDVNLAIAVAEDTNRYIASRR